MTPYPTAHYPCVITFSDVAYPFGENRALLCQFAIPHEPQRIIVSWFAKEHCTIEFFTKKQAFRKPIALNEQDQVLEAVWALPFKQTLLQTPDADTILLRSFTKEGVVKKRTIRHAAPSRKQWQQAQISSSREQDGVPITPDNAPELLRALGLIDEKYRVIPAMSDKYRQINHFLSITQTLEVIRNAQEKATKNIPIEPLRIIDCGCGKAYLSLAFVHWLHLQGIAYELVGIDTNETLIGQCNAIAHSLGMKQAEFVCMPIGAYGKFLAGKQYDIVIALHACDTATDDALHLAIQAQARAILSAPCCHHFVNAQLRSPTFKISAPSATALLLRDGITRERLADLLTDSMRRDILYGYGYRAELLEFTAPEHTMKNIMIRAELTISTPSPQSVRLKRFFTEYTQWHIAPKLADLLGVQEFGKQSVEP